MRKGLWLQHTNVQNFFFAPGSFIRSFPALAVGSYAFVRQHRAAQCVCVSLLKNQSCTSQNGILICYNEDMRYIAKSEEDGKVYSYIHKKTEGSSNIHVCGQLCALLGNMTPFTSSSEMEIKLFSWLAPTVNVDTTLKINAFPPCSEINTTTLKWLDTIFFTEINAANKDKNKKLAYVKADPTHIKEATGIMNKEEWICEGELRLYVQKRCGS